MPYFWSISRGKIRKKRQNCTICDVFFNFVCVRGGEYSGRDIAPERHIRWFLRLRIFYDTEFWHLQISTEFSQTLKVILRKKNRLKKSLKKSVGFSSDQNIIAICCPNPNLWFCFPSIYLWSILQFLTALLCKFWTLI